MPGMFDNLMAGSIGQPGPVQDWPGMFAQHMSSVAPYWAAQHPRDIAMGFVGGTGPAKGIKAALDMSRGARMGRAAEQGFLPQTVYHGSDRDISAFSNLMRGRVTNAGSAHGAHWFAENPATSAGYAELAASKAVDDLIQKSQRAERAGKWDQAHDYIVQAEKLEAAGGKGGENVLPLRIRGKFKEFDAEGEMMGGLDEGQLDKWVKEAKSEGFEGVKIRNLSDEAGYGVYNPTTHYGIFEPKNIRSIFAAFDPAKRNSPDLLAAGLGIPAGMFQQDQQGMFR